MDDKGREYDKFKVPYGAVILVADGQIVKAKAKLSKPSQISKTP